LGRAAVFSAMMWPLANNFVCLHHEDSKQRFCTWHESLGHDKRMDAILVRTMMSDGTRFGAAIKTENGHSSQSCGFEIVASRGRNVAYLTSVALNREFLHSESKE
jgi:hypothetical protein